jgi:hypothetical protein
MIIHKGDYFKVRTFFKFDSNSFFKGDLLRIVRVGCFLDGMGGFCKVSNKSWITTKVGQTETENQYSFGKGTNWNIPINHIREDCIPVNFEWE